MSVIYTHTQRVYIGLCTFQNQTKLIYGARNQNIGCLCGRSGRLESSLRKHSRMMTRFHKGCTFIKIHQAIHLGEKYYEKDKIGIKNIRYSMFIEQETLLKNIHLNI